ncbi:MAG TPA: hypothetical protein VJV74_00460 [Terriglobia bacterium]|nr:hypothetical protein [Terriglobia bacterium]
MASTIADAVKDAIDLWDQLRVGLFLVEDTIQKIIEQKAWEPLGYDSFFEAWDDKMSDISLAKEIQIRAAYQMLAEGVDADRIAMSVKGIGPRTVENIKRERENGLTADQARGAAPRTSATRDKPNFRRSTFTKDPEPRSVIKIDVGPTMFAEYARIAKKLGRSVPDIAKEAIEARFAELAKGK